MHTLNPCVICVLCVCSNKPNPNQLSVNSVKPGLVNGAGAIPGAVTQPAGLGRACESCYSELWWRFNTYTNCKIGRLSLSLFLFVFSHQLISVVLMGAYQHAVQTVRFLLDLLEKVWWLEDAHETWWRTAWTQPQQHGGRDFQQLQALLNIHHVVATVSNKDKHLLCKRTKNRQVIFLFYFQNRLLFTIQRCFI